MPGIDVESVGGHSSSAPMVRIMAAMWALRRAHEILAGSGSGSGSGATQAPPHPARVASARVAFRVAVRHLSAALAHAGGRPGHAEIEAALEEAHEGLVRLERTGLDAPHARLVDTAWRGSELAHEAAMRLACESSRPVFAHVPAEQARRHLG